MEDTTLWKRKFSVILKQGDKGLDLSEFHCKFNCSQADTESPNNCTVRVYNLSAQTVTKIQEYGTLVLQGGYESNFGVIFQGNVKQFRIGKENAKDSYVDILAADGDLAYNFSLANLTLAAGTTQQDVVKAAIGTMKQNGVTEGYLVEGTGGVLPRGKVLFGMARDYLRRATYSQGAAWSIQNGKVQIIPLDSYKPGQAVVLSAATGLIGRPEQTVNGINCTCLLNPKLVVGQALQIDNKSINQLLQRNKAAAPIPYNQYTGLQLLAKTTSDGLYRLFVVEHEGDTRGNAWFSRLTCLAIDSTTKKVLPYG